MRQQPIAVGMRSRVVSVRNHKSGDVQSEVHADTQAIDQESIKPLAGTHQVAPLVGPLQHCTPRLVLAPRLPMTPGCSCPTLASYWVLPRLCDYNFKQLSLQALC